jgi:hypothetical protein
MWMQDIPARKDGTKGIAPAPVSTTIKNRPAKVISINLQFPGIDQVLHLSGWTVLGLLPSQAITGPRQLHAEPVSGTR